MKKFLFGTTALAALGLALAASPAVAQAQAPGFRSTNFDFTIGGYARAYFGGVNNEGNQTQSASATGTTITSANSPQTFDQQSDMRFVLTAATTLPSGIRAGHTLHWEPQGSGGTATGSAARRNWSFVSGGFGELSLGARDNISQTMFVGAPDAFTGPGSANNGKIYELTLSPTKTNNSDGIFTTNIRMYDIASNKIMYITPRFEGFQLGFNYTPEPSRNQNGAIALNSTYRYGKAAALNYTNTVAGVAVQAYGGYQMWEKPSESGRNGLQNEKDMTGYGAGLNLAYMGFGLGGSWATINDGTNISVGVAGSGALSAQTKTFTIDGNAYEAGVSYTFGPAMVSLNYFTAANEAATLSSTGVKTLNNRDEKREAFAINGSYTLAPGVIVMASAFSIKQTGNMTIAQAADSQNKLETKSLGVLSALILNF